MTLTADTRTGAVVGGVGGGCLLLVLVYLAFRRSGQRLEGATVLITGASQGIGLAVSKLLVKKGAKVAMLARTLDKLQNAKSELDNLYGEGKTFIYRCDCANPQDVEKVSADVKRDVGVPDVIVNNAGSGRWRFLPESDCAEIRSNMDAPALAAAFITRAFFVDMVLRNSGSIVQVMSPAGMVPFPGATSYNMCRWALRGFSEAVEMDLWGSKVKVQDVWLGETESEYFKVNDGSAERLPDLSFSMTVDSAAKAVVGAIESGARHTYCPFYIRAFSWFPGFTKLAVGPKGAKLRAKMLQQITTQSK